jgi:hypothetical protein
MTKISLYPSVGLCAFSVHLCVKTQSYVWELHRPACRRQGFTENLLRFTENYSLYFRHE